MHPSPSSPPLFLAKKDDNWLFDELQSVLDIASAAGLIGLQINGYP